MTFMKNYTFLGVKNINVSLLGLHMGLMGLRAQSCEKWSFGAKNVITVKDRTKLVIKTSMGLKMALVLNSGLKMWSFWILGQKCKTFEILGQNCKFL